MFFVWAAIFFLIALVAAAFGFIDISAGASEIARILFYVSLAIFLLLLTSGWEPCAIGGRAAMNRSRAFSAQALDEAFVRLKDRVELLMSSRQGTYCATRFQTSARVSPCCLFVICRYAGISKLGSGI
jgi:uncharacterized membrane protein YtjA (UPF0391 family)